MSSNDVPPAPNYGPIIKSQKEMAAANTELQQEQFQWAQDTYAENKEVSDEVVDSALETQGQTSGNAAEDRSRYDDIFQPLEDDLVKDAWDYDSEERKIKEMGRAQAGVAQQFEAARQNATRDLESFGINPSATRYAALDLGARVQQGAAEAAAANTASENVDAVARQLREQAIALGLKTADRSMAESDLSLKAGNQAVNAGLATTASGASTMGTPVQYGNMAAGNLSQTASTMNTGYQNQLDTYKAEQEASPWGTLAGLAGAGLKAYSSGGGSLFAADGGAVPDPEFEGEAIPQKASPSRGKAIDDVPARLSAGEFVVPKDAVEWFGHKHFYDLIEKSQKGRQESKQRTGAIPAMRQVPVRAQALQVA